MKKAYQIPTTTVVNIELQQMIAASEEVTIGGSYRGGAIQSRQGSSWDDEEE